MLSLFSQFSDFWELSGRLSKIFCSCAQPDHNNLILIETPRLLLREIIAEDIKAVQAITSMPGFVYYCFDGTPEKAQAFIDEALRTRKPNPQTNLRDNHMLAVISKETGEFVGHVCLERVHYVKGMNYEVNFFTDPRHQSKGYGREAIVNMMHYGFQKLNLQGYTVTIHPENTKSLNVGYTEGYKKIDEIKMKTVRGEEPRLLLMLSRNDFYEKRKQDKRPMLLAPT